MTVEIFSFCEKATEHNGALWIQKTFDTIKADNFPTRLPDCQMAVRLRLNGNQDISGTKLTLNFFDPDGVGAMAPIDLVVHKNTEGQGDSACFVVELEGIAIVKPGIYSAELQNDKNESIISMPISIKRLRVPALKRGNNTLN